MINKMKNKHLYTIDMALVIAALVGLLFLIGYATPNVISSPLDGSEIDSINILFSVKNAEYVMISEDENFITKQIYGVEDGVSITLEPGFYYWKAKGVKETQINTFTIRDSVVLELIEENGEYLLVNGGTKNLNVEVYNGTELVEEINLETNEESIVEGTKFIGGEE